MTRRVPITWRNRGSRLHLPYLLIEADDRGVTASELVTFWRAGFNPAICRVPSSAAECPLVNGERCALVESADMVLHRPTNRRGIVAAIEKERPDIPVVRGGEPESEIAALEEELSTTASWTRSFGRMGISRS